MTTPPSRAFLTLEMLPVPRLWLALPLGATLLLGSWVALAQRASTDRVLTTQLLQAPPPSPAASAPWVQARVALQRADQAQAAGDESTARLLEGLAREWAELGQDVSRATAAESDAGTLQEQAAAVETRTRRIRAMIDELTARKARAESELQQMQRSDGGNAAVSPAPKPRKTPRGGRK